MYKCLQCGKVMNPAEAIGGAVCMKCCKANHKKAIGRR